jgi:hypothetical protein
MQCLLKLPSTFLPSTGLAELASMYDINFNLVFFFVVNFVFWLVEAGSACIYAYGDPN